MYDCACHPIFTVQVLSESVSKGLRLTGGQQAAETAKFVEMMDTFLTA